MSLNQNKNQKRKLPKLSDLFSRRKANNVETHTMSESSTKSANSMQGEISTSNKKARTNSPSNASQVHSDESQGDTCEEEGEVNTNVEDENGNISDSAGNVSSTSGSLQFQTGAPHRSRRTLAPSRSEKDKDEYDPEVVLEQFYQKWYEKDDTEIADVPVTWLLVAGGDRVKASNLLLRRMLQFGVSHELLVENKHDYSSVPVWATSLSVDLLDAMFENMVRAALVINSNARQQPLVQLNSSIESLVDLNPTNVKKLCDKLMIEARNGAKRNVRALFDNHIVEAITDQFVALQLVDESSNSEWLETHTTEDICKMLIKAFPLDSAAKAITVNLMDQMRAFRFDLGKAPSRELAAQYGLRVRKIIQDSGSANFDEKSVVAVLLSGLIAKEDGNNNPRVVNKPNQAVHSTIKNLPGWQQPKTIRTFLALVLKTVMDASAQVVGVNNWIDTVSNNNQPRGNNNPPRGNNPPKGNNQPRGNNNQTKPNEPDDTGSTPPVTPTLCKGCGRTNKLGTARCLLCRNHPDRNREDCPFTESKAHKALVAAKYKYPHQLNLTKYANLQPLPETILKTIGQSSNNKGNSVLNAIPSQTNEIILPTFEVSSNKTDFLPVDTLIDTGSLQGNFVSEYVAQWLQRGGGRIEHDNTVIRLACNNSFSSSLGSIIMHVTFFNEISKLKETISHLAAKIIDSQFDLIIGLPDIRKYQLSTKLPSFFEPTDASAPALTDLHSKSSLRAHSAIAEEKLKLPCLTKSLNTNPFANHQLCVIGEIKKKKELLDEVLDADDVPWADNPFDACDSSAETDPIDKIVVHGPTHLQNQIRMLCREYSDIFSENVKADPALIPPMELDVNMEKWRSNANRGPPRPQSKEKQKEISKQINNYIKLGVIKPVNSSEYSQVHLVPKPNGTDLRMVLDFIRLNDCTNGIEGWPIPNITQMLTRIGDRKSKYFGVMDMTSGYHQAPIAAASQHLTSFICFMGIFCWLRVPMGLKNAASYFQRVMATVVLAGIIYIICELYIDDILVFGGTAEDFLANLRQVFQKLRQFKVTLNPKKCRFGMEEVEYVGHIINAEGLSFSTEKREKVFEFPLPKTQKELQAFLGLINYFRDHVPSMTEIVKPMRDIMNMQKKNFVLQWTEAAKASFFQSRDIVGNCPALFFVDENAPIIVMTDASDYGIGAYIYQLIDNKERPIIFMSKALHGAELNWSTIEKEAFAIFHTLTKFSHLLRDNKFLLRTDHMNLTYINQGSSQKVKRWKMALQEFDFDIQHVAGKDNGIADSFSRMCLNHNETLPHHSLNAIEEFTRIPEERYRNISGHHNSKVGHFGVEKTIDALHKSGLQWKYMRKQVRQFIKQCPVCQKLSATKLALKVHPFTTAAYSPMDVLNIDTIGPVAKDLFGNEHIIVIIDCFTRWVELIPIPDTTAKSAARALLQHVGRYGTPGLIKSDRGSQFVNNIISEFSLLVITDQEHGLAYSKEENSLVERANKEVMRHLRALIFETKVQSAWSMDHLPLVMRILNSEEKTNTGVSPAELLFGNTVDLGRRILRTPIQVPKGSEITLTEYMEELLAQQARLIEVAQATQSKHDTHHMSTFDSDYTEFPINSYVLVEPPEGKRPKLQTRKKGPYQVVNFIGSKYTLQDLITKKSFDIHISNLYPFNYDNSRTDPKDVAMHDEQEFYIDTILAHRGDRYQRKRMEFLVKWQGYSDDANSWEPFHNLRDTEQLISYLSNNRLKSLIPAKHKNAVP